MSARGWRRAHGIAAVVFTVLWAISIPTGWIHSIVFISHVSMVALVYAALSAWQSGRTEVKVDENGD